MCQNAWSKAGQHHFFWQTSGKTTGSSEATSQPHPALLSIAGALNSAGCVSQALAQLPSNRERHGGRLRAGEREAQASPLLLCLGQKAPQQLSSL